MIESPTTIFNRVEEKGQILLQWRETSITYKVIERRWIKRKNSGKPERYFHNKYSVQSIWNCTEVPERGNTNDVNLVKLIFQLYIPKVIDNVFLTITFEM